MTVEELVERLRRFPSNMRVGYSAEDHYFMVENINLIEGVFVGWDEDDERVYEDALVFS